MVRFRIPDSVGKDIEKACQSIYPLHDVYVRKVKMLKKPKFERRSTSAVLTAMWELLELVMTVSVPYDCLITAF